jgi:hypothetical protein
MDATVSARFYRLTGHMPGAPDFPDLLLNEMPKPRTTREYDVTGTGVTVRIEHCEKEGDFL